MKEYEANEDLFADFQQLVQRIEKGGNRRAAEKLRYGLSCLNGLTDGWGLLMESIEETIATHQSELEENDLTSLRELGFVIQKEVIRK